MQSLLYGLFCESPWNSESVQIPFKIINDSLWAKLTCFPYKNIYIICYHYTWDIPLHGNFELRSLGVAMGNVIPTPPCWGECKPNSRRRRAIVNSTIWLRELPLWTVDAVSDIIPFGQKPELHTWSTYLLGAGITGPKVELTGLESVFIERFL